MTLIPTPPPVTHDPPMPEPVRFTTRISFYTAMLLVSLLVTVLIAEGGARALAYLTGDDGQRRDDWQSQTQGMFISHPSRSYAHASSYHGRVRYRGERFSVDLNALGLRTDARHPQQPGATDYTILGLGDSQTFGWGVEARDCFLARLEQMLTNTTTVHARVLNAGVIGYGTDQEAGALLELGPVLRPNLVIVGFFANDILDCALPKRIVRYGLLMNDFPALKRIDLGQLRHHPAFVRRDDRLAALLDDPAMPPARRPRTTSGTSLLLRYSVLSRLMASRLDDDERLSAWLTQLHLLKEDRAAQYQRLTLLEFGVFLHTWPDLYTNGWERVQDSLLRMADQAKAVGAELLVLNIPYPFEVDEAIWHATAQRYRFDERDFDVHRPSRLLSTLCQTHGIQYLDTLPTFTRAARAGDRLFFTRDAHLTARGHELIAQDIIRYLTAQHLLPGHVFTAKSAK